MQAFAARDPGRAAALWPSHPTVLLETGLAEVGEMAAANRPVDKALVDRLLSASEKAPLAPEPFLVRGVEAQLAGDQSLALRAFLAARKRNPRAVAPRYFLADQYLRAGETRSGLTEISALARLVPQSLPNVAPYLAAYAKAPGAAPHVKAMVEAQPQLEAVLLDSLAADASNAELIMFLWSGKGGEAAKPWQAKLLNGLVNAGQYGHARRAWGRFTGIAAAPDQLFDPEFSLQTIPPFGWKLESGPGGVAEPQGGGSLHVIYYGRDNLVLASQLLTLSPGSYRLSMQLGGGSQGADSLAWIVRCLPSGKEFSTMRLRQTGQHSALFAVPPAGCAAQRLEMSGTAPEFPQQVELTVSQLRLERGGSR